MKEEVIPRILAMESLDLELWLKIYGILKFRGYFSDFSEARDLSGIIFQIPRPNCKIMNCGLISKKPRCLSAKCQKLNFLGIIFLKETRGPSPRFRGPRAAPVHGEPRSPSQRWLAGERPELCPRAWNLTAVEEKWRGDGGEPHRLQEGAAEGRTRPGNDGEQSVEEALGGVDIADSEASN
jgi:hypothetical protein